MNFIIGFNNEFITKIKVIKKMSEKSELEVDQDKKKDNKSIETQIEIRYDIHLKCSEKAISLLKENNVKFQVWKLHELKEEDYGDYESLEKTKYISIPEVLYTKLDKLCKINNWDVDEKIIGLLGEAVFSAEISEENGFKQVTNF